MEKWKILPLILGVLGGLVTSYKVGLNFLQNPMGFAAGFIVSAVMYFVVFYIIIGIIVWVTKKVMKFKSWKLKIKS